MKNLLYLIMLIPTLSCETGKVQIIKKYYESGELLEEYEELNGSREGFFKSYRKDGTLSLKYKNVNNIRVDTFTSYYPNGKVEILGFLRNDSMIWKKLYDEKGLLLSHNERINNIYYQYYSNRNLSGIVYTTNLFDSLDNNKVRAARRDSGYFYSNTPNISILKYTRYNKAYLTETLSASVPKLDTFSNYEQLNPLKKSLLGTDTLDAGSIPKKHKRKGT